MGPIVKAGLPNKPLEADGRAQVGRTCIASLANLFVCGSNSLRPRAVRPQLRRGPLGTTGQRDAATHPRVFRSMRCNATFTIPLPPSPWRRTLTLALPLLLGCGRGLTDSRDSRICPQTHEFGNYGCAAVEGGILGARSQPLAGISVGPGVSADGGQFNTPYVMTDSNGRFQLRLTRYARGTSESASVWIRAIVIPAPAERVATIVDSALVRLRVAPVGQVPDTAHAAIVLPVP